MVETTGSRKAQSGMVTGLFRDRESAERAYGSLTDRGYSQDDVNLVMSDETRKKQCVGAACIKPRPIGEGDCDTRR